MFSRFCGSEGLKGRLGMLDKAAGAEGKIMNQNLHPAATSGTSKSHKIAKN